MALMFEIDSIIAMVPIIIFAVFALVETQYLSNNNNYNSWSSYSQNYPTWNNQNRASVRGNLLNDDTSSVLPYGSQIIVSITDASLQDVASRPLNTFVLYGSYRFPIAYEIPYSVAQVQQAAGNTLRQYVIQARIEKDGQLLYISDQYTPVRLIPVPINPVNVAMTRVGTGVYPGGGGGIYSTVSPTVSGIYICQLRPETGSCYASMQQYYFNSQTRSCQVFIYGGCGGNQNRFATQGECELTCSAYRRRALNNNAKQKWMI